MSLVYADNPATSTCTKDVQEVCRRIEELVSMAMPHKAGQQKVRAIMNGGSEGIRALVGRTGEKDLDHLDSLPTGNPMLSGLTHLGSKLQHPPDLRIDPPKDSDAAKKAADQREKIVRNLDDACQLDLQIPQAGLWLPGYAYFAWVISERLSPDGDLYPHAELRDPMHTYPGDFGVDQQPDDIAFMREMSLHKLVKLYPDHARSLTAEAWAQNGGFVPTGDASWASQNTTVQIAEYYDQNGCWWVVPDRKVLLEFKENPLKTGPAFVVAKRFAFDKLQGQYDHVIGLMAMAARLTVMQAQFIQDSVHTETNIYGEAPAGGYKKGRFAVNEFDPGTSVDKPVNNMPFQAFQAIDRLERQLRTTARYPVTDDGQSPAAWATGAGIDELGSTMSLEIRMYQTVLRRALERLDAIRLEWTERRYGNSERALVGEYKGQRYATTYRPSKAIAGNYRTRRKYGFMAGWEEPQKLVGGLQLVAGKIIPKGTMRENLDGLDESLVRIEEMLRAEEAEEVVMGTLMQMAQAGEPRALTAAIEMLPTGELKNILTRVFIPDEEEQVPPEQQPPPEQPPGIAELMGNPEILARMSQGGNPMGGGIQVAGEIG